MFFFLLLKFGKENYSSSSLCKENQVQLIEPKSSSEYKECMVYKAENPFICSFYKDFFENLVRSVFQDSRVVN